MRVTIEAGHRHEGQFLKELCEDLVKKIMVIHNFLTPSIRPVRGEWSSYLIVVGGRNKNQV